MRYQKLNFIILFLLTINSINSSTSNNSSNGFTYTSIFFAPVTFLIHKLLTPEGTEISWYSKLAHLLPIPIGYLCDRLFPKQSKKFSYGKETASTFVDFLRPLPCTLGVGATTYLSFLWGSSILNSILKEGSALKEWTKSEDIKNLFFHTAIQLGHWTYQNKLAERASQEKHIENNDNNDEKYSAKLGSYKLDINKNYIESFKKAYPETEKIKNIGAFIGCSGTGKIYLATFTGALKLHNSDKSTKRVYMHVDKYKINHDALRNSGTYAVSRIWKILNQYGLYEDHTTNVISCGMDNTIFKAKKNHGFVIYIDEATQLLEARHREKDSTERNEANNTIQQVLTMAEAINKVYNKNVTVVLAANMKLEDIDPALVKNNGRIQVISVDECNTMDQIDFHLKTATNESNILSIMSTKEVAENALKQTEYNKILKNKNKHFLYGILPQDIVEASRTINDNNDDSNATYTQLENKYRQPFITNHQYSPNRASKAILNTIMRNPDMHEQIIKDPTNGSHRFKESKGIFHLDLMEKIFQLEKGKEKEFWKNTLSNFFFIGKNQYPLPIQRNQELKFEFDARKLPEMDYEAVNDASEIQKIYNHENFNFFKDSQSDEDTTKKYQSFLSH